MSFSTTERAQGEVLVEMPQMGVSVAEGTLAIWHKQVGDWVERDEIICEVSTDKIDTDLPSPAAGRVLELLVAEEETVPVGTALARIATAASPGQAHPAEHGDEPPAPTSTDDREPADAAVAMPARQDPAPQAPRDNGASTSAHAVYSPVVQRIAAAHGIDLSTVKGTGRAGRIRKQDVLAAAAGQSADAPNEQADAAPATALPTQPASVETGSTHAAPAQDAPAAAPPPQAAPAQTPGVPAAAEVGQPLSRMRRAIAEHMTRSLRTAAHCTTIIEADFSRVERERARIGSSPLPIVARAVLDALARHPAINATLEDDVLTSHRDVNLGIAVSLGERGLIVPVIHRAQELSAEGLASRIGELARRAREDSLTPDEVRGGTFTITNPGGFGSIASTPIINQPQVAILDLEAVVKRAVVVTDAVGTDAIAIRPMAYLCLSWDHRALDGALAAQFLATLRKLLEGKDLDR